MRRGNSNRTTVSLRERLAAFINIPYDEGYEDLYLAFIAGLSAFGLVPRATIEIPTSKTRLDRIIQLIRGCRYSFHDLSRVELDSTIPATPRFNMPFELGLAVSWAKQGNSSHDWFVLEATRHRLNKSLSDMNGVDPHIHDNTPDGVLRALSNALSRPHSPSLLQLRTIYIDLQAGAHKIKTDLRGGSLFEANPFRELVFLAGKFAREQIAPAK
ncbi:MAG: hypothetical protein ACYDC3_01450 [Candidatus Binataceae bacterium]